MEYRKFKADFLFDGTTLWDNSKVLITDGEGNVEEIISEGEAGADVETFEGILTPGFINSHCHIELSHLLKVIPEKTGLVDFVSKIVSGRHFPETDILSAIEWAENHMLQQGIVGVGDICNNILSVYQKQQKHLDYYNFIEVSGWNPSVAAARFDRSKLSYDEFIKKNLVASLAPHAPYSVSGELWGKITPYFFDKVVTIHNQETQQEDEFFLKGSPELERMYKMMNIDNTFYRPKNLRSLQTYFAKFASAASVILVHNTFTRQEDIDYVSEHKPPHQLVSFCLCPNANLYIENQLPDVKMFSESKCNIIIGTDSLASNHQLSILEELKTIAKEFPVVETETLLRWATLNGARALQMNDSKGSFEKGKKPGVVLITNSQYGKITQNSTAKKLL